MKKNRSMGAFANIAVGIIGAFIGGFLVNIFGGEGVTGFNVWSLLVAVVGAIVLLWIINLLTRNRSSDTEKNRPQ
jgi:uncharacterized membrane protein YeaQ/YmgE (transglycosylase-associated protein family)